MDTKRRTIRGETAFRQYLKRLCLKSTNAEVAREHGIKPNHLGNLLGGYGCIGEKTAERFGYSRQDVALFVPLPEKGRR
jgi:hypothetical protein